MLLSVVSGFGTAAITANAVANAVTAFQFLPGAAIGLGLVTVVSQCVGAGDYEQARYYTRILHKYAYIALIFINGIIILTASFILKMYNLSPETAALAKKIIIFYGIHASIVWPLGFTLPNTLRAARDVRYAMIVGVGSIITNLFRICSEEDDKINMYNLLYIYIYIFCGKFKII